MKKIDINDRIFSHREKIVIEENFRRDFFVLLEKVLQSNHLAQGPVTKKFSDEFGQITNILATTISSGSGGLLALLKYVGVSGKDVIVPTCSCVAVPLVIKHAGGNVIFADCKKEDLCIGVNEIRKVLTPLTTAVVVIHIGGHLAFDIFDIKEYCEANKIFLIEDCCNADGATFKNHHPGEFGIGGVYSFHASKMMPLGEGGMVVSKHEDVIDFVDRYKNYGAFHVNENVLTLGEGFNLCMSEIIAAFGLIQLKRRDQIVSWKKKVAQKYDKIFKNRILYPSGMRPNYYKYIVFDTKLKIMGDKLFNSSKGGMLSHELLGQQGNYPISNWVKEHHECVPIYYGYDKAEAPLKELRELLCN